MANRIKQLRDREGMSQAELAAFLNTTQATISNWEGGKHDPDNDMLIMLSKKFNVSIDYLLGKSSVVGTVFNNAQNVQSTHFVQGVGIVSNGDNDGPALAVDESELIRIFRLLGAKQRHKLMSFAFDLEERAIKSAGEGSE